MLRLRLLLLLPLPLPLLLFLLGKLQQRKYPHLLSILPLLP